MNKLGVGMAAVLGVVGAARGADFHVTTAQELQNALTVAAVNDEVDTIYVAAGYYIGNFNFNSTEAQALTIQAESGVANHEITIDGAGTGRSMNLTSGFGDLTVRGMTFTRNCGDSTRAGLRLASTAGDVLAENCRAIGVTNSLGIGIEVAAAKNATIRSCTITRDATSEGDGITITAVTGSVTIDRNTVTGNVAKDGCGITVSSDGEVPITVSDNTVSGNYVYASNGGGISIYGTATLTGNTVSGNTAYYSGGGIYISGTATLTGNTVSGNTANYSGGGIYIDANSGTATLTGNTVSGNTANYSGGGIYIYASYSGTATLTGNTVSGNTANYSGGGIYIYASYSGTSTLTGNTVSGNTANYSGGGICIDASNSGTATLTGNTINQNSSVGSGAGIYAEGETLKLINNIIAKNAQTQSGYAGGGIWVKATTLLDMVNNTVTENASAGNGGGVAFQVDGVTEVLHVYNNIIWGNAANGNGDDVHVAGSGSRKEFMNNDAHDLYGVWDLTQNNIDAAPMFYDAANQNYHLNTGSPCLNAGDNAAPSISDTDIDGEARIVDGTVEIGADETSNTDPHPADLNSDWVISSAEYTAYAAAWKNDQGWARAPSPVPADYVTRAGFLMQQAEGQYRNDGGPKPVCWVSNP